MEERFRKKRYLLNKRVDETKISDNFGLYSKAYNAIKSHYQSQELKLAHNDIDYLINSRFIAYIIGQDLKLFI